MGKPIVYCDSCGERLRDEDFAKGKAFTRENRNYCLAHRPSGAVAAVPGSSARIPVSALTPRRAMSAAPSKPPPKSPWPWVAGGAGLGLAILLAALTASDGRPPEPEPAPAPAPRPAANPPPPAPAKVAVVKEEPADERRREAQRDRFVADVRGQIREAKDLEAKKAEIEGRIRAAELADGASRPEYVELRSELAAALERAKEPPGLVGRWTLDEVNAERTADASPNGVPGAVKGKAVAAPGRIGGGLELDGSTGHVELPKTEALKKLQRGSYTLACWYRPEAAPSGENSKDNGWAQGLVVKAGFHTGILLVAGNRFVIDHWLEAGGHAHATGNSTCGAGRYYHVAGVVDREVGEVRVYVDGKRDASKAFAKGAAGRDFGSEPWRIGMAKPNAKEYRYAAKGVIDDVRIYDRALTDDEVKALFSAAK
jgi:hypothetical protein